MKTERGFTLLEVMVALAIFATLAAAVTSASQMILRQSGQLEARQMAAWVLDNHMQSLRLQPELLLKPGDGTSALGGRRWRVEQRASRQAEHGLWHVELSVRADDEPARVQRIDGWLRGPS